MFAERHPSVNMLFYICVIGFAACIRHPLGIAVGCVGATVNYLHLYKAKSKAFLYRFLLPSMLIPIVLNPLVNHEGETVSAYFPWGNPLTLESVIYGILSSFVLLTVCLWFACFSCVMTSDKLMYFTGKALPSLSLLLSMTLRFIPRMKRRFTKIVQAQHALHPEQKGMEKIKVTMSCFSALITWGLYASVETADSMKSRGYGLPHASTYSDYRYTRRDKTDLLFILFCTVPVISGYWQGIFDVEIFPKIVVLFSWQTDGFLYVFYFILCLFPVLTDAKEAYRWKQSVLKM